MENLSTESVFDCLIVGGGPAGLTAATYLARFRLRVSLIDAGGSRAALIPKTRNHAGFPEGIAGAELLDRMRRQAQMYDARIETGRVVELTRIGDDFIARVDERTVRSRTVLLATGVTNRRPEMAQDVHDEALRRGFLRYCPVCDGYEVTDLKVGLIGTGQRGRREAEFVRSFTPDVTLIAPDGPHELDEVDRQYLQSIRVELLDGPARAFLVEKDGLSLAAQGGRRTFDSIYPALGSEIHSSLAARLGADCTDEGCVRVDPHQRTSVVGLFAAGDVVQGLDQISHAMGEAGVAATTMRNDLAARFPMLR